MHAINPKESFCRTIYLCFDPDDPGQSAIEHTGKRLVEEGFDVRVIRLKNGDPNDFLKEHKEKQKKRLINFLKMPLVMKPL